MSVGGISFLLQRNRLHNTQVLMIYLGGVQFYGVYVMGLLGLGFFGAMTSSTTGRYGDGGGTSCSIGGVIGRNCILLGTIMGGLRV